MPQSEKWFGGTLAAHLNIGVVVKRGRRMSCRKAFTLVELLVTTTIITVLMAISIPHLMQAKENAKQVACMSNLHQMGLITKIYLQNNEYFYPDFFFDFSPGNSNTIVVLIQPKKAAVTGFDMYDRKLVVCPRDDTPSQMPVEDEFGNVDWRPVSYGFNIELDLFKIKEPQVKYPHRTAIFYDGEMGKGETMGNGNGGGGNSIQGHFFGTDDFVDKTVRYRHLVRPDQTNVLFADFHVEPVQQITSEMVVLNLDYVHNPGGGNGGGGNGGGGGPPAGGGGGGKGKGK